MANTHPAFFALALAFVALSAVLAPALAQSLPSLPYSSSYKSRLIDNDGNLVFSISVFQSTPFNSSHNASRIYISDGSMRLQDNLKFWNSTLQVNRICVTRLDLVARPETCEHGVKDGPTRTSFLVPTTIEDGCSVAYLGLSDAASPWARCDNATLPWTGPFYDTVSSNQLRSWRITCNTSDGYSADYVLETTYRFWYTDQGNYLIESAESLSKRYDYNTHVLLESSTQTTVYDCYFPVIPAPGAFAI